MNIPSKILASHCVMMVTLLAGCAAPYTPPTAGPTATLRITATFTGTRSPGELGTTEMWQEGNCATKQVVHRTPEITIAAGQPIVVARSSSQTAILGPINLTTSCGIPLAFLPQAGGTYEARLSVGRGDCTYLLLRIGDQGRTERVENISRPRESC